MRVPVSRVSSRWAVLLVTILAALNVAGAASSGCSKAVVAEPFVLPDGSEHAGGTLTLCDRPYTPAHSFLATYVNGVATGLFVTDLRHTEAGGTTDHVIFRRQADGRLRLVAFATPGERGGELYSMRDRKRPGRT